MITVDHFLLSIQKNLANISNIALKDLRILNSLSKQLSQGIFLTENQSKLLIKILNSNKSSLEKIDSDPTPVLKNIFWSQPFRMIQKVRKIYLNNDVPVQIVVEFTYDKEIKARLLSLSKKIFGGVSLKEKSYAITLTEKNIYLLVKEFFDLDFEIDERILDFYHEIEKVIDTSSNNFEIFHLADEKLKKIVDDDVGGVTLDNLKLLHDRKIRYQYQISEKLPENSLENAIAQRKGNKIFIDSKKFSLDSVIEALKNLKRFPLLYVFEGHDAKNDKKMLEMVKSSLTNNNISCNTGIYYRFDKDNNGSEFNSEIAQLGYNKKLDESTDVVGIANNKVPKFMIKMQWKPQSIITFTNAFRNNKSSAYFSDVDLIIYYGSKQPVIGEVDVIV